MNFEVLEKLYCNVQYNWNNVPYLAKSGDLACAELEKYYDAASQFEQAARIYFNKKDSDNDDLFDLYEKEKIKHDLIRNIIYYKLRVDGEVTPLEHEIYNLSSIEELRTMKKQLEELLERKRREEMDISRKLQ